MYGTSNAAGQTLEFRSGALQIDLSPTDGQGLLQIKGTLDFEGASDRLILTAGPQIVPGTLYRIATASIIFGQFDSVTPGFEVVRQGNSLYARLVPEPAMLGVLLPAMVLMQRRRR